MTELDREQKMTYALWNCSQNTLKLLLLILCISFTVRCIKIGLTKRVNDDSILYLTMADAWVKGGVNQAYSIYGSLPPLQLSVLVLGKKLGFNGEHVGYLFSLLMNFLLPIPVFMIAFVLTRSQKMALLSAFLSAIHPSLIDHGVEILRDGAYVTFFMFALAFLVYGIVYEKYRFWIIAGFFTGVAALLRKEGIELVLWTILFIGTETIIRRRELINYLKYQIVAVSLFVFVILFILIPVQLKLQQAAPRCTWRVIPNEAVHYVKALLCLEGRG